AFVDVAVERVRADLSIVHVRADAETLPPLMPRLQIEERGAVIGLIRFGIDAVEILIEEALFLKAVACQRVVRIGDRERRIPFCIGAADLGKDLAPAGPRNGSPPLLGE